LLHGKLPFALPGTEIIKLFPILHIVKVKDGLGRSNWGFIAVFYP